MLRRVLVSVMLFVLLGLLVALVTTRALELRTTLVYDDTLDDGDLRSGRTTPYGDEPVLQTPVASAEVSVPERPLERPMSVVGIGWDRLAPALMANGGDALGHASWFSSAGLDVTISITEDLGEVAEALARGGDDPKGADVVLLPLPQWMAIQDQLDSIRPVIFYVAGWSRGREGAFEMRVDSANDDASGGHDQKVRVASDGFDATYLALFGLETLGIPLARVEVESGGDAPQWRALDLVAMGKPEGGSNPLPRLTTAQASGLIPTVMVASGPWVQANEAALVVWLRTWITGVGELLGNEVTAARKISQMKGSPEALSLMRGLETWDPCSLQENLALFELTGPAPQSIRLVIERTWRILHRGRIVRDSPGHGIGLHATFGLNSRIIEACVRARSPLNIGGSVLWSGNVNPSIDGRVLVITKPIEKLEGHILGRTLTELGSVFPTCALRIIPREEGEADIALRVARALYPMAQPIALGSPDPELSTPATVEVLLMP